jgi:tRNA splicing ligase
MNIKLTAAVLAILGAVVFPLAAQASKPQAVSLTFTMHFTSATTASGTWTSTSDLAALNGKSGTVVQATHITGKGKGKGKKTGQVVHGHKVVTASDGTFVIDFRGGLKPTGATNSEVNGRFVLKKGTGAYKGLHGNGKIHATLDSSSSAITAVYTGKAHVQDKAR